MFHCFYWLKNQNINKVIFCILPATQLAFQFNSAFNLLWNNLPAPQVKLTSVRCQFGNNSLCHPLPFTSVCAHLGAHFGAWCKYLIKNKSLLMGRRNIFSAARSPFAGAASRNERERLTSPGCKSTDAKIGEQTTCIPDAFSISTVRCLYEFSLIREFTFASLSFVY